MWNRKNALKDLLTMKEVLDRNEVRFVLVWGTCLGFVRDRNFIKWDDDIDLMVPDNISLEKRIKIGEDLKKEGFFGQDLFWYIHDKRELRPTDREGWRQGEDGYVGNDKSGVITMQRYVKMTIFFFEEIEEQLVCKPVKGCLPLIQTPKRFFQKFDKINYKGYAYNIPSPVRGYLSSTYKQWRKKDKAEHGKVWSEQKTEEEISSYSRSTFGT